MIKIMEKQDFIQRWFDKKFPIFSYSCGHKLIRVTSCHSGFYCTECELIVPEMNVVKKEGLKK